MRATCLELTTKFLVQAPFSDGLQLTSRKSGTWHHSPKGHKHRRARTDPHRAECKRNHARSHLECRPSRTRDRYRSYLRAMERFFEAHGLQRIIFDTPSKHLASNSLKYAWGISPCSTGTFGIPTMSEPLETIRYQVERSDLAQIVDRVERNWKYRATSPGAA